MNCKNINRKNKVIVLFIGILLLAGSYHLTQKKYQMYVFRYLEYLECGEYGEAESPLKKRCGLVPNNGCLTKKRT